MKRSLIENYMSKVASGDLSYTDRLSFQIIERLVFIPVLKRDAQTGKISINAPLILDAGHRYVPLFTSAKRHKEWIEKHPDFTDFVSLLGGDFCAALDPGIGLMLDPETENSVNLSADIAGKIAFEALNVSTEPQESDPIGLVEDEDEDLTATQVCPFNDPVTSTVPVDTGIGRGGRHLRPFAEKQEDLEPNKGSSTSSRARFAYSSKRNSNGSNSDERPVAQVGPKVAPTPPPKKQRSKTFWGKIFGGR